MPLKKPTIISEEETRFKRNDEKSPIIARALNNPQVYIEAISCNTGLLTLKICIFHTKRNMFVFYVS
jgi:hypothetical protein